MDLTKPPGGLVIRRTSLPSDIKDIVIKHTMRTGKPLQALEDLGYAPHQLTITLKDDPHFAEAITAAKQRYVERLEEAADTRAVDGWDEPVYQKGEMVGTIRKFSDTLLIERLRAEAKSKYGKHVDIDAKVTAGVLVVPASAPDAASWAATFSQVAGAAAEPIDVTPRDDAGAADDPAIDVSQSDE